ncbi:urea amidolyase associated protein UAAP1 [Segniliparus rugosus]|uniref:Urea carboxylase-associated protein 2 n=1 Tax=Segniliparus rugosus (strain ATCC BAA-974 / DSM 45345 / CCUG 50838 / CIP 108380 / JCM 13579 / CDC 945) TaxID=679197 RepID=E5XKS4_SEGRC|nr:urea amidolyase associated protein UAAP1 [Segniliparus rugosus]EFV15037.1 urea carboxylase-associated protein 2 [Segniliparus rugosus ATCC BAA-974]
MGATDTTKSARSHARAQAGQVAEAMPMIPASESPWTPDGVEPRSMTWAETVPGGGYTAKVLARGTRLRLVDLTGRGCASVLLYRADAPWERLNAADTLKVPWQAYLGLGHPLLSDQGRLLATVVADSSGRHDAFCGVSTLAGNKAKYGAGEAWSASPAGRELLLVAAAKQGLEPRDVAPCVSFFHGVAVEEDGSLRSTGTAGPGACVDLLLHLPVIVLLATAAHPLDPSPEHRPGPVRALAWDAWEELNTAWNEEPEYLRAVENTEDAWTAAHPREPRPTERTRA